MARLIPPDETMLGEIAGYRQAFLDAGDSMDGTGSLRRMENPADWLAECRRKLRRETAPPGWVPCTQLCYVRGEDGRIVGMIDLRHELNDYLREYAGHIGYSVRPDERRKGYATRMLLEALPLCRAMRLGRVMIACLTDNEASRRTILRGGGVYWRTVHEPKENIDLEQYWIAL